MNRRDALLALLALSSIPIVANSQQQKRVWRIGSLSPGYPRIRDADDEFVKGMGELGYVLSRDYVLVDRFAREDLSRLPALASELIAQGVDLIVPAGTPAVLAARDATREIPIVFFGIADPVATGIVTNLARPGGNVTGFARHAGNRSKQLDLLRQMIPDLARLGATFDPKNVVDSKNLAELESSCKHLGIRMIGAPVGNADDLVRAFSRLKHERAQGLVVLQSALSREMAKPTIGLAAKHRLPAMFLQSNWVDAGGLISYDHAFDDLERRYFTYIDRILKGAKPGDLPIEQPNTLELVVNRKTAKALGLVIPQSIIIMANRVVE